jgi:hypothetical protein
MHALNVSCVMHLLWEFVMVKWTFVMHELYVPSDKSMCMFCMIVGCCLPWRKLMKDKKTLYTIFIAIGIFNYTLAYKGLLVACLAMKEDLVTSIIKGVIHQASLIITLILQHTLQKKVVFITQNHNSCSCSSWSH